MGRRFNQPLRASRVLRFLLTPDPLKPILVGMSTDEFTRLFTYMEKRFDQIDKRFDNTDKRIDQIMSLLDTLAKRQEIDEDERLVMRHHLEQLDQWVHQLAEKIGVKLSA